MVQQLLQPAGEGGRARAVGAAGLVLGLGQGVRQLVDRGFAAGSAAALDRTALLTADAAEPKSCADYRAAGLPCRAAVKGPGSVAAGMKWLQSLNAIIIDPVRCPETAAEFTGYEYLRDARTGEVTNAWPDADNHHIDAVRYALESVWRRRGS